MGDVIGDYELGSTIGLGGTAKVKLGTNIKTGQTVAVKIMKKKIFDDKPDLLIKLQREISLMKIFNHPHLLKLIDYCESEKHVYLILEYAQNGELFDYLANYGALPAQTTLTVFRQLIYGLDFLHAHNICHRDIKPENILLDTNFNVKIADFGFARFLKSKAAETSCGSPHYAAPEVIKAVPYDGKAADVWSCGVVLYLLLTGKRPFEDRSLKNLLTKIKSADYVMPDLPADVQSLIKGMLTIDPAERLTIEEIKAHPAFRLMLPEGYVVPTPLPDPQIVRPLDVSKIPADILENLEMVGFGADELRSELGAEGHNEAKAFFVLITKLISFENLPWAKLKADKRGVATMTAEITDAPGFTLESPQAIIAKKTKEFRGIRREISAISCAVQKVIRSDGFLFFFPDEFSMFARNEETGLDVVYKADCGDEGAYDCRVELVCGEDEMFDQFAERVGKAIEAIPAPKQQW